MIGSVNSTHQKPDNSMSEFTSFSDLMVQGLKGSHFSIGRQATLMGIWTKCTGSRISENTFPLSFQNNILTIVVADNTWKKQLELLKEELIMKLSQNYRKFENLADIKFRIGEIAVNKKHIETQEEECPPIPDELTESFSSIDDDNLRNRFTKISKVYLSKNRERSDKKNG